MEWINQRQAAWTSREKDERSQSGPKAQGRVPKDGLDQVFPSFSSHEPILAARWP